MRAFRNFKFCVFNFSFAFAAMAARAGHVQETLTLSEGWNAVYIESVPDGATPASFFADMPSVQRVGCYESSVYGATDQIASDGSTIAQKPVSFYVWERGKDDESTLQRMLGGRCYLVYAAGAESKTYYGVPSVPRTSWQSAEGDGFLTLLGVSIPPGDTVASGAYCGEGPLELAAVKSPRAAGGADPAAPEFTQMTSFRGTPAISAGRAYAFEGSKVCEWPGVVKVSVPTLSGVLAFGPRMQQISLSVANAGTTNRTVRVAYGPSELEGEAQPPLQVFLPAGAADGYGWTAFATHDLLLAPGESRTLVLAVDRANLDASANYAALVTVSDLSGTKMRVRVPVTLAAEEQDETNAAWPKGLWCGNFTFVQVDQHSDGVPVKSGGDMKVNAVMLVDSSGAAHLLQRVAVGTSKELGADGTRDVRLWAETGSVPATHSARRLSAVFPDVGSRDVAASAGSFGDGLEFRWTVEADARDNPFRHAWHPDHAEGFAVTNRVTLSWRTEANEPTFSYTPDETTYGICTWSLGGLLGTGEVKMRGTFALKRILPISKIEE